LDFIISFSVFSVPSAPKRSLSVLDQRTPSPGSRERGNPDGAWALFMVYGALKGMNNCGEIQAVE
jgi:hypothetical protein